MLSFLHSPGENVDTKYYYAFTFPFSYTECQNLLDKFDRLFKKTPDEMNSLLKDLTGVGSTAELGIQSEVSKEDDIVNMNGMLL